MRQTTVATIGILIAIGLVIAPGAVASHQELSQSADYVSTLWSTDPFIFGTIGICQSEDLGTPGINVVCFDLTGAEHEIDFQIDDAKDDVARAVRKAQTLGNGAIEASDDVIRAAGAASGNATVEAAANAVADEVESGGDGAQDAANPIIDDVEPHIRPVSAFYSFDAPFGAHGAFCDTEVVVTPADADGVTVFLDDLFFGNVFLSTCGTLFSGATVGTVLLNVEVDP